MLAAEIAAAALAAARARLVLVSVHGDSMRPSYAAGDLLLGTRTRVIRRGRVIVFRPPTGAGDPPYRVKRVVATPGDPAPPWVAGCLPGARVPPGNVVVRGDAAGSEDSRHYGLVPREAVLAVICCRVRAAPRPTDRDVPADPGPPAPGRRSSSNTPCT